MQWTWYLACDVQFYLLIPVLVAIYYHNRKSFWMCIVVLWFICGLISSIVIVKNDFSASYFTYKDSYWSKLYERPWTRLPSYLIGIVMGCSYYSYKHEQKCASGIIRQQVIIFDESDPNLKPIAKDTKIKIYSFKRIKDDEEQEREPESNLLIVIFDKV